MPEAYAIRFGDVDRLRKEILIQTGRYKRTHTINGTEMIFPKSISFADMGGEMNLNPYIRMHLGFVLSTF